MPDQQSSNDALGFASVAEGLESSFKQAEVLLQEFTRQSQDFDWDPLKAAPVYNELFNKMLQNPQKVMQANLEFWKQGMELYQNSLHTLINGSEPQQTVSEEKTDRRFRHDDWLEQPVFNMIKQSYLLMSQYTRRLVQETEGLDEKTAARAEFLTQLYLDAMSPTNFVGTNPQVIEKIVETKGMNLVHGLKNMLDDLERGKGKLSISMTDYKAFELGKNVATTAGKVVYENRMLQLIQYAPLTEQVNRTPLLIVPPWINKYYILDLQEKNSLIRWLTAQGHSVFVISWVNPDQSYAEVGFEDYVEEGVLAAIDAIEQATGESQVNAIGYCIGGTLLATSLAYLKAQDKQPVKSATFLTTMLDFSEPGELGMFIDEEQLASLDEKMDRDGYLDGSNMAGTFNLLRANDLIWSFYINNYLLGNDPRPFDLLYWNSDSTRMPAKMHKWYLHNLYLKNNLVKPGEIKLKGIPIDLSSIDIPVLFVSTVDDHIAPWKSTWMGAQQFSGPVRFILSGSGHIAGIVNPPEAKKYGYRITASKLPKQAQAWADRTTPKEGSWWPEWEQWVAKFTADKVTARQPGDGRLAAIEDAPGRYVKTKIVNI
ncbi:MAG: class I poly(R)-hydroxyalkanoic acid synthase [Gammaproteobacteria bacterium]|nr:class I poly(R)-hydroxyalkanoic acid synthase [Gammaproteobacteria bacterium]